MDNLVKRLRSVPPCNGCGEYPGGHIAQIMSIAADHIEALQARVAAADRLALLLDELRYVCAERCLAQPAVKEAEIALAAYEATKEGE